jgi:hypothetical protein
MDRRLFIKIGTWASLGVGLVPSSALPFYKAKNTASSLVNLPVGTQHIRHGLLNMNASSDLGLAWLRHYQKDIFLKDGCAEGQADLTHLHLGIKDARLNIGIQEDCLFVSDAEDTRMLEVLEDEWLELFKGDGFSVQLLKWQGRSSLPHQPAVQERFLIPLGQSVRVDQGDIPPDTGILFQGGDALPLEVSGVGWVLLLSQF